MKAPRQSTIIRTRNEVVSATRHVNQSVPEIDNDEESTNYSANDNDDQDELEPIEKQRESDSLSIRSEEDEESRDSSVPPSTSSSQSRPNSASRGGWSDSTTHSSRLPSSRPPLGSIPSLLNFRKHSDSRLYHLYVVQHPLTGAECGSLSRIPLAPPLFVQLVVQDRSGKIIPADDDLPFLVAIISLHKADSQNADDLSSNRELNGTTVAGPSNLQDMYNNRGIYFIFPDVGIHRCGRWKLHVSLVRIAQLGTRSIVVTGDTGQRIAGIWTDPLDIKPQQTYVAPKITPLTKHFIRQGVQMFISSSVVPG